MRIYDVMQASTARSVTVRLPIDEEELYGDLSIPANAKGLILFAHGSGSSRNSPRNQHVAEELQKDGLATFLLDLLTEREEMIDDLTKHLRFNIAKRKEIRNRSWRYKFI